MSKRVKVVFSGSGTLYPVHVGGVLRLVEEGFEITDVCGTSGGAIVAAALGSGYQPNSELIKLIKATLPHKHNAIDPSLWTMFWKWGLIRGEVLEIIMKKYLALKLKDCKINTNIVVTNLEEKSHRVFNNASDPEFSLAKAIRASISIPFVFEPVKIDDQLYVDGGVSANFPLDIFGTGNGVIGFRVLSKQKAKLDKIRNVKDYTGAVIETFIESTMREHIEDAVFAKTIFIESDQESLNFNITDSDVDRMIQEGYSAVDSWLKSNTLEGYE